MAVTYKIHPAIGVARVGDSDDYYIAPETTGGLPIREGTNNDLIESSTELRDEGGKLKRQAARFQIYKHNEDGTVESLDLTSVEVEWTVRLANKKSSWYEFQTLLGSDDKHQGDNQSSESLNDHTFQPLRNGRATTEEARKKLNIDPGSRAVTGLNSTQEHFNHTFDSDLFPKLGDGFPSGTLIETLGSIHTDEQGKLIVLGGYGNAFSPNGLSAAHFANNDDWFDDISDGPVIAEFDNPDGSGRVKIDAWVIAALPAYAPEIPNILTLYDTVFDTAVRELNYRPNIYSQGFQTDYMPHYDTEIKPIFDRLGLYKWVSEELDGHHGFVTNEQLGEPNNEDQKGTRERIFRSLRHPDTPNSPRSGPGIDGTMPKMAGDNALGYLRTFGFPESRYLTMSRTQYFFLEQWAAGDFIGTGEDIPEERQENEAQRLDRAQLENCVGGGFSPGMEMTWLSRAKDIYRTPFDFRIDFCIEKDDNVNEDLRIPMPRPGGEPDDLWGKEGRQAGDLSKYMAVPWQADFFFCTDQPIDDHQDGELPSGNSESFFWWPPQRPINVFTTGANSSEENVREQWYESGRTPRTMVDDWKGLGFVVSRELAGLSEGQDFVETQRTLPRITLEQNSPSAFQQRAILRR